MSVFSPTNSGKARSLADFTSEELIIPNLRARDRAAAILELSSAFPRSDAAWDAQKLNLAAWEREQQMSTAMDFGAAFPHVRSGDCPRMQFALGRAEEPFAWGPPGSLTVRLVFLNAIPAKDAMGYLKLLSGMARIGKEPALLEQFQTATTARELLDLLGKISLRK